MLCAEENSVSAGKAWVGGTLEVPAHVSHHCGQRALLFSSGVVGGSRAGCYKGSKIEPVQVCPQGTTMETDDTLCIVGTEKDSTTMEMPDMWLL